MKKTIALFVFVSAAACGPVRRGPPFTPPPQLTTDAERRGQAEFFQYCNGCHQGAAGGIGPALDNKPLPGQYIHYQVRHGLGGMPAFTEKRISDTEIDDIVAYLKALRRID